MSLRQIGKLYVVATPIGNLDDISYRAVKLLGNVNWIAAEDTRHSQGLLSHLGLATPLISYHAHNEHERAALLIEKLLQGESGALISDAGTPLMSDPGYTLVASAHKNNIPVIPIPGACSLIAALSAGGLPTDKFLFEGFLSSKKSARRERLRALQDFPQTIVFFEAPHRIAGLIEDCRDIFAPDRQAVIARELTKKFETITLNSLQSLYEDIQNGKIPAKGEFVVAIAGMPSQPALSDDQNEAHMQQVLGVLLTELSVKQAVSIAVKLTGLPKNALYQCATRLQEKS
jgi:16S rRNA (cytidine1402-2'-O)-methyltransferase